MMIVAIAAVAAVMIPAAAPFSFALPMMAMTQRQMVATKDVFNSKMERQQQRRKHILVRRQLIEEEEEGFKPLWFPNWSGWTNTCLLACSGNVNGSNTSSSSNSTVGCHPLPPYITSKSSSIKPSLEECCDAFFWWDLNFCLASDSPTLNTVKNESKGDNGEDVDGGIITTPGDSEAREEQSLLTPSKPLHEDDMSGTTRTSLSLEDLVAMFQEWKYGHGKNMVILRSVSAIISMISSALLIWVIFQSKDQLTTTYHRLLIGMSISDFLYSFSMGHFSAMAPADLSYIVWNARGNQATCDAMGFLLHVGGGSSVMYMCSLNIYFLVKVKYNRSDKYIRTKIEPFLHGVPIALALLFSTIFLVRHNYNDDGKGACQTPVHDPPHCIGYEDGQVPEGFEIPCGRGREGETFSLGWRLCILFGPPIIIPIALGSLYRFVSKQEKKNARYGGPYGEAVDSNVQQAQGRNGGFKRLVNLLLSPVNIFRRKPASSSSNQDNTYSRAVAQRALAYSMTYPLSWGWPFVGSILILTGVWNMNPLKMANWQLAYTYMWAVLNPMQGLFTFLIFMHPNVMKAKRSRNNISLCQAFFVALWTSITGGNKKALANNNDSKKKNAPETQIGSTVRTKIGSTVRTIV